MKRIFGRKAVCRSEIVILAALALFLGILGKYFAQQLPPSSRAPHAGQKAPDFTLPDQNGQPVSLASLLKSPHGAGVKNGGVILIFYRGYW